MQLNAVASYTDLLATVDLLCIPLSRDMVDHVHTEVLSLLIPSETLPPVSELNSQNHSVSLFYGHWKGRRIKVLISFEGEKLSESNAFIVCKRLSVRSKSENANKVGLMVHHLNDPELVTSAFTGWTSGQYDLGLFKN